MSQLQDIRLSLLGITGSGKSTTGNFLLDKENRFQTSGSSNSETFECSDDVIKRDGREVKVIDTPGFLDTRVKFAQLQERIIPFLGRSAPGPHALLYVMEAGRFTDEQQLSVDMYTNMFGEGVLKYTTVVFTKLAESTSETDYMRDLHGDLKTFLEKCGHRYVFLPALNKTFEMKAKIGQLYNIIDRMITENCGSFYTNTMFEAQQKILKAKMEEECRRQREEKEKEINEIKADVEAKYKETINRLQNDVQMSTQERMKNEAELQALKGQIISYDDRIKNLQTEITLGNQRIVELSKREKGPKFSLNLGPISISW